MKLKPSTEPKLVLKPSTETKINPADVAKALGAKIVARPSFVLPPHINAEPHKKLMERLDKMTREEQFMSLVNAGICDKGGNLRPPYNGEEIQDEASSEALQNKTSGDPMNDFFNRAGRQACISQLLYLGYQVIANNQKAELETFFVDRDDDDLCLFQVFSSEPQKRDGERFYRYTFPRKRLCTTPKQDHFYAFAMRQESHFAFVVLRREELEQKLIAARPPKPTEETLELVLTHTEKGLTGWGQSFQEHLYAFEKYFPKKTRVET
jgi:hypothetical protein